jgi:folate-binding protein YgfZ
MTATRLSNRAVIRLTSLDDAEDVPGFLQGLVTQDVMGALPIWAALLTPQGKCLFDFLVWPAENGLMIDCEAEAAPQLARRLSLYRLRRKIAIQVDASLGIHWSIDQAPGSAPDPRLDALGWRWLAPIAPDEAPADTAWREQRLALGVTEGVAELGSDQTLWLECNAAELNGVSFTKGCYVGQENTARMNWRQKVNRRLLVVPLVQSDPARRRVAYPELGLAVDHRRIEDIAPVLAPDWMKPALATAG